MKRAWVAGLVSVVVLVLAGIYLMQGGHTPSGQPVLVEMNSQAVSGLQAEFNRMSGSLRVILLLSPT